jgi:hypothetical protein
MYEAKTYAPEKPLYASRRGGIELYLYNYIIITENHKIINVFLKDCNFS